MATRPIYFPKVSALFQTPRIQAPQNNSGVNALSAGLSAITDVANNWRQKQQSIEQANRTADALDREGMTSEANLYRAAADNFSVNYFATPAENQKFNKGLISDTLSLLEGKQNRELKQAQIDAMAQSRSDTLFDRRATESRLSQQMQLQNEDRDLARQDRAQGRSEGTAVKNENSIKSQIAQTEQEKQAAIANADAGRINQDEFAKIFGSLQDKRFAQEERLSDLLAKQGVESPKPVRGAIPTITPKTERDLAARRAASERASEIFKADPTAASYTDKETGITYQNPRVTNTSGIDAKGNEYNSTTTTGPAAGAIKGSIPKDPLLNLE